MNSKEKVRAILAHKGLEEGTVWLGHLNDATVPLFAEAYGTEPSREAISQYLSDDCRWIPADGGYRHPEGRPPFDPAWNKPRNSLSAEGCFAEAEIPADLEAYPWPDPAYLDFTDVYREIDKYPDKMVFTGMWSCFFHLVCDFFGMENYFIKMFEYPAVVDALTEKIVDFLVIANDKFFAGLGDRSDVMFFGNDLGTQLDLIISPEQFRRFILPSYKRLIAVGKKHGKKIMTHSCGSIYRIIPDLIDAGIDILHPLQAQAAGMSAANLAEFRDDLVFVGGIDAQRFFVDATPEQIRDEVHRVREILGPNYIISPSHEEVLPNVPAANLAAMAEAAHEFL